MAVMQELIIIIKKFHMIDRHREKEKSPSKKVPNLALGLRVFQPAHCRHRVWRTLLWTKALGKVSSLEDFFIVGLFRGAGLTSSDQWSPNT